MKKAAHYLIVIIPFMKDIFEIIPKLITNNMEINIDVFDLITKLSVSILLAYLITMILNVKKRLEALDKYSDNTFESVQDIIDLHETINKRKLDYLYSMLKDSNLHKTPPKSFLGDFEKKLLLRLSEKRQKEINEAVNSFNNNKNDNTRNI